MGYKEERGFGKPSTEGLAATLRDGVLETPERFAADMTPFLNVQRAYQQALLWGLYDAWRANKDFAWDGVLDFILQIIKPDEFWNEEQAKGSRPRDWLISQTADLIEEGIRDDGHAFDAKLLPRAEEILLTLVKRTESELTQMGDLTTSVLNSEKGKIFSAMVNYSLRYARLFRREQTERWVETVKEDFNKRLDRLVEPSLEFSLTLGRYLPNLWYLDEKWVKDNINRIFPKEDEKHWQAAFTGYLFYSRIYSDIYALLREQGHYDKALQTQFNDE